MLLYAFGLIHYIFCIIMYAVTKILLGGFISICEIPALRGC